MELVLGWQAFSILFILYYNISHLDIDSPKRSACYSYLAALSEQPGQFTADKAQVWSGTPDPLQLLGDPYIADRTGTANL